MDAHYTPRERKKKACLKGMKKNPASFVQILLEGEFYSYTFIHTIPSTGVLDLSFFYDVKKEPFRFRLNKCFTTYVF